MCQLFMCHPVYAPKHIKMPPHGKFDEYKLLHHDISIGKACPSNTYCIKNSLISLYLIL